MKAHTLARRGWITLDLFCSSFQAYHYYIQLPMNVPHFFPTILHIFVFVAMTTSKSLHNFIPSTNTIPVAAQYFSLKEEYKKLEDDFSVVTKICELFLQLNNEYKVHTRKGLVCGEGVGYPLALTNQHHTFSTTDLHVPHCSIKLHYLKTQCYHCLAGGILAYSH